MTKDENIEWTVREMEINIRQLRELHDHLRDRYDIRLGLDDQLDLIERSLTLVKRARKVKQ